jgi:phage shock protein PspC (stress-responsive transcriptional regulator)
MNEVTQIHLGRTAFTIAVDAQKELRDYLAAIKAQVGKDGADVLEEIELRMAELLSERGITGDKVVVAKDIAFLREQLGEPSDFSEDDSKQAAAPSAEETPRRLFRDTDNAMVAGVAAGLANYFDIDAVIVRIIFVALVFAGGSGVLIYILLWLLVPEARTASERLSMQGKAATIDNLKQVVERADIPGAARRSSSVVAKILRTVGVVLLFMIGIPLVLAGGFGLLGVLAMSVYLLLNGLRLGGQVVAPIGGHEVVGFIAGVVLVVTVLFALLLVGIAMIRRRWQLPAWGVAALVGVFFVSASIGGALAADTIPTIQHRVTALHHTKVVKLESFTHATVTGSGLNVVYMPDSKSYVSYSYYGTQPVSELHTSVSGNTLRIAAGAVADNDCDAFCADIEPGLEVDIHAPRLDSLTVNGRTYTAESSALGQQAVPVFFGWHPRALQRGTIEYGVPSSN